MHSSGTYAADSVAKALAEACADVRDGAAADAIGEGVVPAFVALPASTGEAAAVLRVAAEHELAVVPRGGGSRLGWGAPPSRCDVLVDMSRMDAVLEHAAGDLVARLQAGARMGDVAAALAAAGQEIALDVPAGATAGGVVASGLGGPAAAALRVTARPAHRDHDRAGERHRGAVRREGRQERRRLRPRQALRRIGGDARADHRGDVPAAPAARGAGVRGGGVRRFRWAGRLRRRRRGRELVADRVGRGTEPAVP